MDHSIVPAHLAVKAMRDNGYKNAAYAIAELMDNSIQHDATKVELLCAEIEVTIKLRQVSRINKIAVLDNGSGMSADVLQMALQFGNGTHLSHDKQKGIGKFGMGLPSSSISQAKRVEVWTWQNGIDSAIYSYLDIDEIIAQTLAVVPEPIKKPVPELWKRVGKAFANTGTLVVWSNIDRCIWKTAQTIIDNSEFIIGRMYRKFLQDNRVTIRLAAFKESNPSQLTYVVDALPNDPIYLMAKTSCPEPFSNAPMFNKWGGDDAYEVKFDVPYKGEDHEISVRFSMAKEEARQGYLPGARPYGKHAGKNIGVSVVRADRELELNQSWVNGYDPRERWWGIEVDFPPALDEVFGVTNNKQFANNFTDLGKMDIGELLIGGKTIVQLKEELEDENDPKALLIEIAQQINNNLGAIRTAIRVQAKNLERDDRKRHSSTENTAEQVATEATEERKKDGHIGTSDKQEDKPEEERKKDVEEILEQEGVTNAEEVTSRLFSSNLKYQFVDSDFESHAFFTVKPKGGKIIIALNTSHPAYHKLVEVLDEDTEGVDTDELRDRLINASDGLKLLLMAWARYEDEQPDGDKKTISQNTRMDWGRIAKEFLKEE